MDFLARLEDYAAQTHRTSKGTVVASVEAAMRAAEKSGEYIPRVVGGAGGQRKKAL